MEETIIITLSPEYSALLSDNANSERIAISNMVAATYPGRLASWRTTYAGGWELVIAQSDVA